MVDLGIFYLRSCQNLHFASWASQQRTVYSLQSTLAQCPSAPKIGNKYVS